MLLSVKDFLFLSAVLILLNCLRLAEDNHQTYVHHFILGST